MGHGVQPEREPIGRCHLRVLVICPHHAPDTAPTGEVMTRIVTELAGRGHELEVVTSLPWYADHAVVAGWEGQLVRTEEVPWGRVRRLHPFPTDKGDLVARALAFGGFSALAALLAAAGRRPDVVLAMSPPLTLGTAGWLASRRWKVPLVFNVQDVFPDVAIELGHIRGPLVIRASKALERFTYRRSDAVVVLSEDLARNVSEKVPEMADRVHVIPNFVDTVAIRPGPRESPYRADHGLQGKLVVMYAGNVGWSQSLDLLLTCARRMRGRSDVAFVVNGAGVARESLRREAEDLSNVVFVDPQPRERLSEVLAAADLHVVPLRTGLAASSVPSKMYSILAAGRPIVASVDPGTEVARTVVAAGAGLAVPPDDPDAFHAAVDELLASAERREAMGLAGRTWVEGCASPAAVGERYEELLDSARHRQARTSS